MKLRYRVPRPLLMAAFWCCLATITWLALMPFSFPPSPHSDKVGHVAAFLALGLLGFASWPHKVAAVFGSLVAYGIGLELAQATTTYRTGEGLDVAADLCGLALAWIVFESLRRIRAAIAMTPPVPPSRADARE